MEDFLHALTSLSLDDLPIDWISHLFSGAVSLPEDESTYITTSDLACWIKCSRALSKCTHLSPGLFWQTITDDDEIEKIVNVQKTIHRPFLVLCYYTMCQTTSSLECALVASKCYFLLLQLNGSLAYGIFMPSIYRQGLSVLKNWSESLYSTRIVDEILTNSKKSKKSKNHGLNDKLLEHGQGLLEALSSVLNEVSLSDSEENLHCVLETTVTSLCIFISLGKQCEKSTLHAFLGWFQKIVLSIVQGPHGEKKGLLTKYVPLFC